MKESPSPQRAPSIARIGAAFILVPAFALAACAPGPDQGAPEGPAENPRLTSIEPAPVADSELAPTDRGAPPLVCDEVALSVAEVSQITGVSLPSSEPAPPGGRPEMCAYGGSWDDPAALFIPLEGNKDEPTTSASASTSNSPATTASEAPEDEEGEDDEEESLTAENSVFVSARELHAEDSPEELLESIPEIAGPVYECTLDTNDAALPELDSSGYAPIDTAGEADGVSALGPVSGYGMSTEIGSSAGEQSTASAGASSSSRAPRSGGAGSDDARQAREREEETVEIEVLRCDNDPTGHVPHTQAFFVTDDQLWQVSMTVSEQESEDLTIDQEAEGLLSLAAYITENV